LQFDQGVKLKKRRRDFPRLGSQSLNVRSSGATVFNAHYSSSFHHPHDESQSERGGGGGGTGDHRHWNNTGEAQAERTN